MARILVIDDDAAITRLLQRVLTRAGHVVEEAADGRRGLSAYRQQPADLVMTDIVMPDMEGLELITHLREIVSDLLMPRDHLQSFARSDRCDTSLNIPFDWMVGDTA